MTTIFICFPEGKANIFPYKEKETIGWATKIAARYMGRKKAVLYGKGGEGTVLVRIRPKKIIAEKDVAILD